MQVLHLQVFAGIMAAGALACGVGIASLSSGRAAAEARIAKVEAEVAAARKAQAAAAGAGSGRRPDGRDLEQENAQLAERVRALEARAAALERENALLKDRIAASAGVGAARPPSHPIAPPPARPQGGVGGLLASRGGDAAPGAGGLPLAAPPLMPPPGDPGQVVGDWNELEDMASALRLVPEQREEARKAYREMQDEHDRLLVQASNEAERDLGALERIGAEVRRKFDMRIEQMLFSEQRPLYAEWKRKKAEAAAVGGPR